MSRGLRYLFDRNRYHALVRVIWGLLRNLVYWWSLAGHPDERIFTAYDDSDHSCGIPGCNVRHVPPAAAGSNNLSFFSPALAFAQWKVFRRPFSGADCDSLGGSVWEAQEVPQDEESNPQQSVDMPDTPTAEKLPKLSLSDNAKEGRPS